MSIKEISAEEVAKTFFLYQEALGPEFSSVEESRPRSWSDLSSAEKGRMVAAARLTLMEIGHSKEIIEPGSSRYFAVPGTAEWGC